MPLHTKASAQQSVSANHSNSSFQSSVQDRSPDDAPRSADEAVHFVGRDEHKQPSKDSDIVSIMHFEDDIYVPKDIE